MTDDQASRGRGAADQPIAGSPDSLMALADELVAAGRSQAEALGGQTRNYLLSHFSDRRLLAGELRLVAEYSHWIPYGATVLDWGCGPALPSLALHQFRPDLKLKAANFDPGIQAFPILWGKAGVTVDALQHPWLLPYQTIHWM